MYLLELCTYGINYVIKKVSSDKNNLWNDPSHFLN